MAGRIEMKLAELGITLPRPMPPIANYVPYVVTGNLVVVSGQVPAVDGKRRDHRQGRQWPVDRAGHARRRGSASSMCWCI